MWKPATRGRRKPSSRTCIGASGSNTWYRRTRNSTAMAQATIVTATGRLLFQTFFLGCRVMASIFGPRAHGGGRGMNSFRNIAPISSDMASSRVFASYLWLNKVAACLVYLLSEGYMIPEFTQAVFLKSLEEWG